MLPADWTAEINYLANSEGSITMKMSEGPATKVAVHPGLNRVFVRLPGAGDAITVRATTAALALSGLGACGLSRTPALDRVWKNSSHV